MLSNFFYAVDAYIIVYVHQNSLCSYSGAGGETPYEKLLVSIE